MELILRMGVVAQMEGDVACGDENCDQSEEGTEADNDGKMNHRGERRCTACRRCAKGLGFSVVFWGERTRKEDDANGGQGRVWGLEKSEDLLVCWACVK